MTRLRQKTLAWTAIAVAGLVVLLLSTFWRDIVVEYKVFRLRRDPDYAWALLSDGPTSISEEALERFLASPTGREWALEQFVENVVEPHFGERFRSGFTHASLIQVPQGRSWGAYSNNKDGTTTNGSYQMRPEDLAIRTFALINRLPAEEIQGRVGDWSCSVEIPTQPRLDAFGSKTKLILSSFAGSRISIVTRSR